MGISMDVLSDKIQTWKEMAKKLKELKVTEMALRKEICIDVLAGKPLPARLTLNVSSRKIKFENDVTRNIDEAALSQVWKELTPIDKNAVKLKPSVIMAGYRVLIPESLLHEAIIVKPSAPTIKIL